MNVLLHFRIELSLNLEYFLEVFIQTIEKVIDIGIPDQNDFDITFNRLGLEPRRGNHEERGKVLDFQFLIPQGSFECLPDSGLDKRIERIDD